MRCDPDRATYAPPSNLSARLHSQSACCTVLSPAFHFASLPLTLPNVYICVPRFWQAAKRFVEANSLVDRSSSQRVRGAVGGLHLLVRHWFIPEDVTPDYYHFTFWRMFQRFVAGTINVFGTQVSEKGGCTIGTVACAWCFYR